LKILPSGRIVVSISKGLSGSFDLVFVKTGTKIPVTRPHDIGDLTLGGPSLFPEVISTKGRIAEPKNGYASDGIPLPKDQDRCRKVRLKNAAFRGLWLAEVVSESTFFPGFFGPENHFEHIQIIRKTSEIAC
jgi:hypothetical protein